MHDIFVIEEMEGELSDRAMRRITSSLEGSAGERHRGEYTQRLLPFHVCRNGTWLYRGQEIKRRAMLCLFASLIDRDEQGRYWLTTPTESGIIHVDDVPFLAVELDFRSGSNGQQNLCLRTNMDELLCVGDKHPLVCDWDRPSDDGTVPYVHIRSGSGGKPILARVSRAVVFELAALAVPGHVAGRPCLGVWSQGHFFPLSRLPQDDDASLCEEE